MQYYYQHSQIHSYLPPLYTKKLKCPTGGNYIFKYVRAHINVHPHYNATLMAVKYWQLVGSLAQRDF